MYKRTKYKIPFYPAYINASYYYRDHVYKDTYTNDHEQWLAKFEDWLESQGAYFHKRSPSAKQNHNIFFASDEQRTMFLLKVGG